MKYLCILLSLVFVFSSSSSSQKKSTTKHKVSAARVDTTKGLVIIETSMGNISIQLFEEKAPKHSENFKKLAKEGFYAGTTFHRVIPGFMIQGGDPNSKDNDRSNDGLGGPGYTIDAEIGISHDRGVIAAARQGDAVNPQRKSNGSQFYITVADAKFLDGQYSVFGKVVSGMDVVDKIVAAQRDTRDNPIDKIIIKKVYLK
jgi:cyclophilin family peptidyl-prolyl cis-trans isomerase